MVTDTLTGNILMKMFSSFTTGGSYEASGFGYGPGIGEDYKRNILILSRASGSPVVSNALKYAADISKGNITSITAAEYDSAKKAGLSRIIEELTKEKDDKIEEVKPPDKEVVTSQISGIDIMDLEEAVRVLWKKSIYAESGMGCTGPIVLVSDQNKEKALKILSGSSYIVSDKTDC
jgi:glycine reductase